MSEKEKALSISHIGVWACESVNQLFLGCLGGGGVKAYCWLVDIALRKGV